MTVRRAAWLLALALAAGCGDPAARPALAPGPAAAPAPGPAPAKDAPIPECRIEVVVQGSGRRLRKDDVALVHLLEKVASSGRVLVDTRAEGEPQPLTVGSINVLRALTETLSQMSVGDRWKVAVPSQRAWGEFEYPGIVPARADLELDIEVAGLLEIGTEPLATGAGPLPVPGEYVLVHAVGSLAADGKIVQDTRKDDAPVLLHLGVQPTLPAWETLLRRMRVGDRVKTRIPWQLGHGVRGEPPDVPPKADLVYDLERLPLPEIRSEVLTAGEGPPCTPGRQISVHYTGSLAGGREFDSTRKRNEPLRFVLGAQAFIAGWDLALARMRQGDRWKVTIPWQLAYGASGNEPDIPKKADLVYDIEVVEVK